MPWTYILRCNDGSFYTGSTNGDLESRVWEHNNDEQFAARFTRRRRPVVLACAEQSDAVDAAFFREKQIQGWSRAKKIALIEGRNADLPDLSRSRGVGPSTGSGTQSTGSGTQSTGSATQRRGSAIQDPGDPGGPSTGSGTQSTGSGTQRRGSAIQDSSDPDGPSTGSGTQWTGSATQSTGSGPNRQAQGPDRQAQTQRRREK